MARQVRWLIIQPYWHSPTTFGPALSKTILDRVGSSTVIATVDRSAYRAMSKGSEWYKLYTQALELPHVATPELAQRASTCRQQPAKCDDGSEQPARSGYMFHGDMNRFDMGVRGAMRSIMEHLKANVSLQPRMLSRGWAAKGGDGMPESVDERTGAAIISESHRRFRNFSLATSAAMLRASMCFAPQGDIITTRRLFDTVAAACVPVVMKNLGNAPKQWLLGNNPFPHSINWRALAFFMAPRGTVLSEREGNGGTGLTSRNACRREETQWLEARHADAPLLRRMRHNLRAAFTAHLDVEHNPRGLARAILHELNFVLEDAAQLRRVSVYKEVEVTKNGRIQLPPPQQF